MSRPNAFKKTSFKVLPSLGLTLAAVCVSAWLPGWAPTVFQVACGGTGAAVVLTRLFRGPTTRLRAIHQAGRHRLAFSLGALGLSPYLPMAALTLALAGGVLSGLAGGAAFARILATASRSDLVRRIERREAAKRSRAFWFGRAPR